MHHSRPGTRAIDCGTEQHPIVVDGIVCIELYKKKGKKKLCLLNLHTALALEPDHTPTADASGTLVYPKSKLDKLAKDKQKGEWGLG